MRSAAKLARTDCLCGLHFWNKSSDLETPSDIGGFSHQFRHRLISLFSVQQTMTKSMTDNLIYIDDYIDSKLCSQMKTKKKARHSDISAQYQLWKHYKLIFKRTLRS